MSRYDPPDPLCRHIRHVVRYTSHRDLVAASRRGSAVASVWVCDREVCQEDARTWVRAVSGREAIRVEKE